MVKKWAGFSLGCFFTSPLPGGLYHTLVEIGPGAPLFHPDPVFMLRIIWQLIDLVDEADRQHAATLIENKYSNILAHASASGLSPDYVRVNGKPYIVGERVEH